MGHGPFVTMFYVNSTVSAIFILLFFFAIVFFLLYSFMGIYMDSYKMTRIREGYNDDQNWTVKDFLIWFFGWIPAKIKSRVLRDNKPKRRRELNMDDEEDLD